MKKLLVLLFSLLISFNSFGEWLKANETSENIFYIDFDTFKEVDGSFYVWQLTDFLNPDEDGNLSAKIFVQGDCQLMRIKMLSIIAYTENMGKGSSSTYQDDKPEWRYAPPESSIYDMMDLNCFMLEGLETSPEEFDFRVQMYKEYLLTLD